MFAQVWGFCVRNLGLSCPCLCAGMAQSRLVLGTQPSDMETILRVNLLGSMLWSRAVVGGMVRRRSGVIVNVGSVLGQTGGAGSASYSASKSGLIGGCLGPPSPITPTRIGRMCGV